MPAQELQKQLDTLREQLDAMPHVMFGGLVHEPAETLARRLAALPI